MMTETIKNTCCYAASRMFWAVQVFKTPYMTYREKNKKLWL